MPAAFVDSQLLISPTKRAGRLLLLNLLFLGQELLWSCLPATVTVEKIGALRKQISCGKVRLGK